MRLSHRFEDFDVRDMDAPFDQRVNGPDSGVINAWRAGVAMRGAPVQALAEAGELPVLPFRGGVERPLKIKQKIGALHYLAMWQGLRGEDLELDTEDEPVLVCARHGVKVLFTLDYEKLRGAGSQD